MTKATNNASTKATKGSNKEVISGADVGKVPAEVIATASAPTKADLCRKVFDEAYAQTTVPQRKDIIAQASAASGLSKAGTATYLQNYKDKKGLSVKKAKATA